MTEWYFVWVEGLRGPVPQKGSSDGLWGQVGRQDVIIRFPLSDAEADLPLDELARGHPIPDARYQAARAARLRAAAAGFRSRPSAEHCEFNFVAGLNGAKQAPL